MKHGAVSVKLSIYRVSWKRSVGARGEAMGLTERESALLEPGAKAQFRAHLESVLASETFRGSHTARRLLEYIATYTLDGRFDEIKESILGVAVLRRKPGYDSKADNSVRVQAHRLRQKLADYYETEGRLDTVRISIPRGRYYAEFETVTPPVSGIEAASHLQSPAETCVAAASGGVDEQATPGQSGRRAATSIRALFVHSSYKWRPFIVVSLLVSLAGAAGYWFAKQGLPRNQVGPVERLWSQMLDDDSTPIIAYSTPPYMVDEWGDLLSSNFGLTGYRGSRVDPHVAERLAINPKLVSQTGGLYYENGYTTTGDLEAVIMLFSVLNKLGRPPIVKRADEITPEDLRNHDMIMLGPWSLFEATSNLPTRGDFYFDAKGIGPWNALIVNSHPSRGEDSAYGTERASSTGHLTIGHGVISYGPGIAPGHHAIALAGLEMTGTASAASFITSAEGASELLSKLQPEMNGNRQPFFQAVVRGLIDRGNQITSTRAVAIHRMPWTVK
jgi:hypothetical protein